MAVLLGNGKIANRSLLFSPGGEIEARFDKIHMFDVELPGGETYREFEELPGRRHRRAGRPAVGHARA